LQAISAEDPSFRSRQLERLSRFGASYAYGVFVEGQIAHVSWLLPPTAIEKDVPRVLRARVREAEITCSETLAKFRGRGIYGAAIRKLVEVARGQGVCRVFMKTAADNRASRSAIEKAGLERVGSVILIVLPVIQRLVVWRCFR
jgi:ribosomal protein S18 acetylase RimI-like enzyme